MRRRPARWLPGLDPRAEYHPADPAGPARQRRDGPVVVVGGGVAGLAAATGLAERGVPVTVVEREQALGGRVRSWPIAMPPTGAPVAGHTGAPAAGHTGAPAAGHTGAPAAGHTASDRCAPESASMSRGFHAFFRQYYNLRALLRRADPGLERLVPLPDYPLQLAGGPRDSFAAVPRTPPLSIAAFVARSPSFPLRELRRVDVDAALGLLDVTFPRSWTEYDGVTAADVLDRLRFPQTARHLALEVFARSFFADPREFSGGELVAMFHAYFVGSAEGLLFDVPDAPYDEALWRPLAGHLERLGVTLAVGRQVVGLAEQGSGVLVALDDGAVLQAADVVLATDRASLQQLVAQTPWLGDEPWRQRLAGLAVAPSFAVWRLWLDRRAAPGAPAFLGTSGFGPLDNVSFIEQLEPHARRWADRTGGSVVEVHAYALSDAVGDDVLRQQLRAQLDRLHPELSGARILHEEWLRRADCPLAGTDAWADRPGVTTPDPRVVLAGDGIRCEHPVALMERAATTGWLAANTVLHPRGLAGHALWTVPSRGRGQPLVHGARQVIRSLRSSGDRAGAPQRRP